LNNYTQSDYDLLLGLQCKYVIIGKEVGESGTPHLQGYIVFLTNKRLSALKREHRSCHWEQARGDTASNVVYCSKEGAWEERGTRPLSPAQQALAQHERWKDVIRSARAGTAEDEYPREFVQYNSCISRLYQPSLQTIDSYSGLWFFGRPGTGKSRTARADFPGLYDKLVNKWWDGYAGEETVLVDDLGKDHKFMGSFLKRWCDHYPFRAEHKGGSKVIRPKTIIVTSNYKISEIWDDDSELVAALERRFTLREF
jgi:hypothetical protein